MNSTPTPPNTANNAPHQSDLWANGLLTAQALERSRISLSLPIVDICDGNIYAAILLGQILYWFSPGQDGRPRVRVHRWGDHWLAKQYSEWWEDCRINEHTARKAIARLKAMGFIETRVGRFNALTTVHIRPVWHRIQSELSQAIAGMTLEVKAERPERSKRNDLRGQSGMTLEDNPLTDISTSISTETTHTQESKPVCVSDSNSGEEGRSEYPIQAEPELTEKVGSKGFETPKGSLTPTEDFQVPYEPQKATKQPTKPTKRDESQKVELSAAAADFIEQWEGLTEPLIRKDLSAHPPAEWEARILAASAALARGDYRTGAARSALREGWGFEGADKDYAPATGKTWRQRLREEKLAQRDSQWKAETEGIDLLAQRQWINAAPNEGERRERAKFLRELAEKRQQAERQAAFVEQMENCAINAELSATYAAATIAPPTFTDQGVQW